MASIDFNEKTITLCTPCLLGWAKGINRDNAFSITFSDPTYKNGVCDACGTLTSSMKKVDTVSTIKP